MTVVTSFHPSKFFGKCFKGLKFFEAKHFSETETKITFFFLKSNFHILIISRFIKDDEKLKCESFDGKNTAGVSCRIIYHVHLLQQSNKMPVGKTRDTSVVVKFVRVHARVLSPFPLTAVHFNNLLSLLLLILNVCE